MWYLIMCAYYVVLKPYYFSWTYKDDSCMLGTVLSEDEGVI
jgi:hypothetical protein